VAKLQLGSGGGLLEGWLNTDRAPEPGTVYLDARHRFPLPEQSFDYGQSDDPAPAGIETHGFDQPDREPFAFEALVVEAERPIPVQLPDRRSSAVTRSKRSRHRPDTQPS